MSTNPAPSDHDACPTHEELQAFGAGKLSEEVREAVAFHLQACACCRATLDALNGELDSTMAEVVRPTGAAASSPKDLSSAVPQLPDLDSRYQLLKRIDQGGVGEIFKARDRHLARDLAIKVLLERHQDDPAMVQRFLAEAQIIGQLQHPGIVPVHELGRLPDGRPYIAMTLVQGRTLADLLGERDSLAESLPRFLTIFQQVCQTLAYAHSCGVIHRDLKPRNIMVGKHGEVLVMDWGMGKVLQKGDVPEAPRAEPLAADHDIVCTVSTKSTAGQVLGTLAYMPPEQAQGQTKHWDKRSDVFGLGAILCELLTGQPPYVAEMRVELYRKAEQGDLADAWVRLDNCGADEELRRLTKQCLARDPQERPRNAEVVAQGLAAYLASVQQKLQAEKEKAAAEPAKTAAEREARRLAEVAQEAAQARAAQERRARRLTVALAASSLITLLLGGGSWIAIQHQNAVRRAETAAQVNPLVEQAVALRAQAKAAHPLDLATYHEALETARRAQIGLEAGEGDQDLYRRVQELVAELEGEATAAQSAAAQAAKDRQMVQTLQEIRLRTAEVKDGHFNTDRADPDYAAAFQTYGIDVEALPSHEAAKQIALRSIRAELVVALDDWMVLLWLMGNTERAKRLAAVTSAADPDPQRGQLRDAVLERDKETLKRLALDPTTLDWPAPTLYRLGRALERLGNRGEAVAFLRKARERHPTDFWINNELGLLLSGMPGRPWEEAIGCFLIAVSVRGDSPGAWHNLGHAFYHKGAYGEAVAAYRQAVRLKPDYSEAHNNLGLALKEQGHVDEAIAEYRRAIELKPNNAAAHNNLGLALQQQGRLDEAIALYRDAIRLKPDLAAAHSCLGHALHAKRALDEAVAEYRRAIELRPNYAVDHYNLGNTLWEQGQTDEAIAHFRRAIQIDPTYAEAHCNLGHVLESKGLFSEALAALKRGDELGSKRPRWPYPSQRWVNDCKRLLELDARLPALLVGKEKPAQGVEATEIAKVCKLKGLYGSSARFYEAAFASNPELAEDFRAGHRYSAACVAALAGCGQGKDDPPLGEQARTRWRRQALDWLRADLVYATKQWETGSPPLTTLVQQKLQIWQVNSDLAGVRDQAALAKLPHAEEEAWNKLWSQVDALLRQMRAPRQPASIGLAPTSRHRAGIMRGGSTS